MTGADYETAGPTDETYQYDANGNRTDVTNEAGTAEYDTALDNRLEFDGTYVYEYDAEGNRTRRTDITSGETTVYTWDHRNRLVSVDTQDHTYINFDTLTPQSYSTQDGSGTSTVLDGGRTLHLVGNKWMVVDTGYDEFTANTVIELDFKSDAKREWHAIAIDDNSTSNQVLGFQFYGTQSSGEDDFKNYQDGEGWKHYVIPVGQYLTGDYDFLVFVADDDASPYEGDSWFRDVRIYEADETTQEVDYAYDAQNQLINREVDVDGTGGSDPVEQTFYLWESGQIVLQFDRADDQAVEIEDLSHRYLWGPAVDQLLADEQVESLTNASLNDLLWALTDHLGSVRDGVDDNGTVRFHHVIDSFGNVVDTTYYDTSGTEVSESHAEAISTDFIYTCKLFDTYIDAQYNNARWYDAKVGRWLSKDYIYDGPNPYSYVANMVTTYVDDDGLQRKRPPRRERPERIRPPHAGGPAYEPPQTPPPSLSHPRPNWNQGAGQLHHHVATISFTICAGDGQTADSIADDIFLHLQNFDLFNGGHNNVATVRPTPDGYLYFNLSGFLKGTVLSDLLAFNDDEVGVGVTTDQESHTVMGTTLGDHQLVGQRRWTVTTTPLGDGCSIRVTIKTETYERPRNWQNSLGLWAGGGYQDMIDVWEGYLLNIQDWATGNYNVTEPGTPNTPPTDFPGWVPNPWGPPDQHVPISPPVLPVGFP